MNIFHHARIKLTIWYLAIIMTISLSFSFFVYRNIIGEVSRSFRIRSLRTSFITSEYLDEDQKLYRDVRNRIIMQIALVNGIVLGVSAAAGYLLAGKTLRPIEIIMEDQKRFIGDASHELRTPLTALKTEIEVNLRDRDLQIDDAKKLLVSNLEEVHKMQSLTNYLLSLTRYEDGSKGIEKININIDSLIHKTIKKFDADMKKKKVKVIYKSSKIMIRANEVSLEELISILLDNSIKYSKDSGIVRIKVKSDRKNVDISVSDNGIGIKATDIPHIFNRFYRADTSRTKTRVDGYGLGLSIAQSIVNMHKGRINVVSEIGKGSTFKVTIPKS